MAIKIDLEKAYDRLNWDFIVDTLKLIGIPDHLVDLIWHCISSSSMNLLWNGEVLDEFRPSRGIRQGDPISPYLFVLCLERLFHLIEEEVRDSNWRPIKLTPRCPPISHLAFADDLLLFAEASVDQAMLIKGILHKFCKASGQKISLDKTRIFFSDNVAFNKKMEIKEELGFQFTNDLGKYLGIPIFHKRVNQNTFQFIIDKVTQRLSSWKARTLSMAGRVTLTKSVLQALPSYVMQSCVIPKGVCDDIDKICRGFVWGEENGQRKFHSIGWDRICKPKQFGGLGLKTMRDINASSMLKASWNLCSPAPALWKSVINGKYNTGRQNFPNLDRKRAGSNFWQGLNANWDTFRKNLVWKIGNGETTRFWEDAWLPNDGPLIEEIIQPLDENLCQRRVSDFVNGHGN